MLLSLTGTVITSRLMMCRSPCMQSSICRLLLFFFNETATTDIYTLSLHDALPISVKDCVTIDVLPRTPGNNVYVGFMVWSNFTATKCRGLVSLNQVIKEIICLQPLK